MTETLSQQVKQVFETLWEENDFEGEDARSAYFVGLADMRQSILDLIRVNRLAAAPELLAVLEYVEWVENEEDERFYCPCCDSERGIGHHDDCQLASALARARAD